MHFFQAADMGMLIDGVWTYKDPEQNGIALAVQKILHWDLTAFDAWLHGNAHWRSYPRVRQQLLTQRAQLTSAFRSHGDSEVTWRQSVGDFFCEVRRLVQRLDNVPVALRQSMVITVPCKPQPRSGKLDARSTQRIQRMYQQMVDSGQKYGAQTKLAQQYGVSLTTLRKILRSPQ